MLAGGGGVSARQDPPPDQQPTFRSGVQLIEVDVRVFDRYGRFVTDLTKDDFEVLENGRAQIATFETEATEQHAVEEPKPTETVDFWKQKAREQEKRAKENAAAAKRLAEVEESQKSEAERLADRATKVGGAEVAQQQVIEIHCRLLDCCCRRARCFISSRRVAMT